jgi:hypothetical protein|tara:strand:+ start:754 stop:879 length:126 start_codon:yes stop_codon:yes gene_type:complete
LRKLDKLGFAELFNTLPYKMGFFASQDNDVDDIYGANFFAD